MIKLLNKILKLFNRRIDKIRCIDEIHLDSISIVKNPIYPDARISGFAIEGITEKEHDEYKIRKTKEK